MHTVLTTLIDRLESLALTSAAVIKWGSPVPAFGDPANSRVATLGLNPSNREFVDDLGNELQGELRRFQTLGSLGISSWSNVDARHLNLILESCRKYFFRNPYDRWFKVLNQVVVGANASFYDRSHPACHLDLIPYATTGKWIDLTKAQRACLMTGAADALGLLLRDSPVRVLILNGKSVVDRFQEMAGVCLDSQEMSSWSLARQPKAAVTGIAYRGVVESVSGIRLSNEILILGYNHNLQSSFGVTNQVVFSIRDWISQVVNEMAA